MPRRILSTTGADCQFQRALAGVGVFDEETGLREQPVTASKRQVKTIRPPMRGAAGEG
jgi:hypothetical protein